MGDIMNVLMIKANDRDASESISRQMYDVYIEEIQKSKDIVIQTYDVFEENMPYMGQDLFNAIGKKSLGIELNEKESTLLTAKQKAMDAFTNADVIVIAFPLWNLTIPARLQTFIDYIYSAGFTFKYDETGNMIRLMPEKKVVLLNARGGIYSTVETSSMDMAVNYLHNVFAGIFGMEILDEIVIEGHNAMPHKSNEIISEGLKEVSLAANKLIKRI